MYKLIELPLHLLLVQVVEFQNWVSESGGQLIAGRCLDSNEINNVKDLFLPCKASALCQQVSYKHVKRKNYKNYVTSP
jgi:hypothetical protein